MWNRRYLITGRRWPCLILSHYGFLLHMGMWMLGNNWNMTGMVVDDVVDDVVLVLVLVLVVLVVAVVAVVVVVVVVVGGGGGGGGGVGVVVVLVVGVGVVVVVSCCFFMLLHLGCVPLARMITFFVRIPGTQAKPQLPVLFMKKSCTSMDV